MLISEKFAQKIYKAAELHSPDQRLFMGVTALATQPFIDLNNKKADEDTRILSTCRTVAKILAGTISGVIVRAGCIKGLEFLTADGNILSPKKLFSHATEGHSGYVYKNKVKSYNKTLGTAAALGVMLFTNFLWDAPVTKKLTNFFYAKATKNKASKKEVK